MSSSQLIVSRLGPADLGDAVTLFEVIATDPAAARFHPHPFDAAEAARVCSYRDNDLYLGARRDGMLVGYGLLRGWDEGYSVPTLGIYICPSARGQGLGVPFMRRLHDYARARGANRVMLKVYPDNLTAIFLYRSIGYVFLGESAGQLVGYIDI